MSLGWCPLGILDKSFGNFVVYCVQISFLQPSNFFHKPYPVISVLALKSFDAISSWTKDEMKSSSENRAQGVFISQSSINDVDQRLLLFHHTDNPASLRRQIFAFLMVLMIVHSMWRKCITLC